jgi:hypothetical protein
MVGLKSVVQVVVSHLNCQMSRSDPIALKEVLWLRQRV